MKSQQDESRVGLLEIVCALAVLAAVVGSVVWRMNFNLIIALFMLVAVYAVLRDLRIFWQLKKGSGQSDGSERNVQTRPPTRDVSPRQHASAVHEQKESVNGTRDRPNWQVHTNTGVQRNSS